MNSTARIARENALKRHQRELSAAKASARWSKVAIAAIPTALICATIIAVAMIVHADSWNSGKGPAMQKLEVRAYGYVDKEGNWRSYDTGEKIEVKGWRQP